MVGTGCNYALIGKQVKILCGPAAVTAFAIDAANKSCSHWTPLGRPIASELISQMLSRKTCLY